MEAIAPLASVTITTFLVIVIMRAAWHKLERFLETVGFAQGYGVVPDRWAAPIVRVLTAIEIGIVLALLIPATRMPGAVAAALLFTGYGLLMATALMRGRSEIDCGCGGAPQIVSGYTLLRNAILAGLALIVAVLPAQAIGAVDAAAAIAAALVLAAIYAVVEKLASHLPNIRAGES
ncbi:MauE/DoxX family redox-associated membrane protein [Sedimentitalea sp. XS_ASV28]|uniref:MauE/DoxX family redox-associated membrane protein n=1 Tax=Sedimentitalea sp. XS_ASV28 TaxID=3241296 RepID=UPI0035113870